MGMPSGFISLAQICPDIQLEMSYSTINNFTGQVVPGYRATEAYLGEIVAHSLVRVQKEAQKRGLSLKIFDAYRPEKAVIFFQEWAKRAEDNLALKKLYYPKFSRLELFEQGYIAFKSSHTRGCAVDLTLTERESRLELDMGTRFDYFDSMSMTDSSLILQSQRENRQLLKELMEFEGFKNFSMEWWHFSYRPEPFPDQYFDFDIDDYSVTQVNSERE